MWLCFFFFFIVTSTTEIYTLSLHDALPIFYRGFRDTHKFAALLALAYAYLGAFGLQTLVEKVKLYATSPRWR